jgi:peptidoglycan/xylan/chitin deacetylase (PgdA/CDA1 family)
MHDTTKNFPREWTLSTPRIWLATASHRLGLCETVSRITQVMYRCAAIRVVNYHQTLASNASILDEHFRWYAQNYHPATREDLGALLRGDAWRHRQTGLILTFDDGLRSNYEVAAPLLERYGLYGWFFIPTSFIECPVEAQRAYASQHQLLGAMLERSHEDRVAMTWRELRDLSARGHEIGSHTQSHARLGEDVAEARVREEVLHSKLIAENRLGKPVRSFCWVGGEVSSYSRVASECISQSGYEFAFQTTCGLVSRRTHPLQIPRTNVEDRWPLDVARFQTSGIVDLIYARKRRAVTIRTAVYRPQV